MDWMHRSNIPKQLAEAGLLEKYVSYDEHPEGLSEIRGDWFKRKQSWARLKREAREFAKQLVREGKTEVPKRSPKLGDVVQLTKKAANDATWRNVSVFGGSWEVGGKDGPTREAFEEVRGIIVAKRKKWYIVVWDERGFEQLVKRYAEKGKRDRVRGYLGYLPWEVARSGLKVVSDKKDAYRRLTREPEKPGQYVRKKRPPASKPEMPKLAPKLQRAVGLLAAGMTPREVAKELGVYDSQVRKWMNHPDFAANMKAQGMKHSSKEGWKAKSNGGSRILYHIGKRPAQPEKKRAGWRGVGQDDSDWVRPWLDSPVSKAVFLTSNPILVSLNHGISGHVYAYEVPRWVIKKAQGIHRYDRASEVLIPDTLWKHVKFLGKSMEKDKLYEKAAQYDDSAYNKHREEEGAKRRKRQWSPSSQAAFLRAEWEDDDGEAKFNPTPQWLPLSSIQPVVAEMEAEGVSEVARSKRGFLTAYKRVRGDVRKLGRDPAFGQDWVQRRNNFVKRHMGQIRKRGEPLWVDGRPSRRHLALIAWAYSPTGAKLKKYTQAKKNPQSARQKLIVAAREVCAQNNYLNCRLFTQLVTGTAKLDSLPKVKSAKVGDVLQFGSNPARHWALYLGKNEVVEVPEWGEPARISSMSALVEEWDKPTYIRRPPRRVKAKSMRKNPKIKSVGLPLSKGEGVTDSPQQWRKGLVKFQRLVEGLGEDLPTGVWVVAMGFPAFELVDSIVRHGRTGGVVKPPLNQYKHSWAALYKDEYTGVWVVEAINYTGYPAGGEASLFPLRLLKPSSNPPQLWEDLDQATTAYGVETPFELEEEQDMVDSVKPVLSWASRIIDAPWETPMFRTLTSPQARIVQEFDRAQRGKKNPREKNTIAYAEKRMRELDAERRKLRPGSAEWKEVREKQRIALKRLRKARKHTPQSIRFPKRNPRGSDIYDPREEQLRAQRQAIYESSLLRDEPQLKFKSFRNSRGERLDQHVIEEGDFPWLQKYIGKKMFRIGVGVQKRDRRLKRKDGYLSLTAKTIGESKRRYADVDKLVRNRQDYEESLALMRKSSFYRVTKEPTRDGWVYFVWPMQPGQRIPKGFSSKKRAENVANLANRDAPTVGGAWWKPPKKKYTKRELGHWLPPADIWRSK